MAIVARSSRWFRFSVAILSTAILAACGGGGGGGGGGGTTPPTTFTVGGTVTGLATGASVVLQNNGGGNLTVSANGNFTFAAAVNSGAAYAVTVLTNPAAPAQTCTVTSGSGTASANVTSVAVNCVTRTFTVGGSVSGLTGTGLVIQNNAGGNTTIGANGNFTFAAPVASGAAYAVTVLTQPSNPTQVCTVANGSGTIAAANVTNVTITCASSSFTVGGSISGLVGSGLVLQNNGGSNLSPAGNGPFTFAAVASGSAYAVTVLTQPSNPAQTCVVANGAGTIASANITNVAITCSTNSYTIGGTVSGLNGTGLVIRNNGVNLPVSASGSFTFAASVASGSGYAVTVQAQPTGPLQNCVVSNGSGTVVNANITNIAVTCTNVAYTVSGSISGYSGNGLVLQLNGANNLTVTSGFTSFSFATTPINSGGSYAVTVLTQPSNPTQNCVVGNGSGTITANVSNVTVTCTTLNFTVGGTVSGLTGSGLVLRNNGGNNLNIAADGTFTFSTSIASGQAYAVTVFTQPSSPAQTCTISNGNGTVGGANVTNVAVTCADTTYTVGGTVSGLSGTGLVLRNNGGNNLTVSANGSFTFSTALANGSAYAVTVFTQPSSPTQSCVVGNGSGTIAAANVTNITVTCSTTSYTVGGTVTGLGVSTGLVIRNNGGNDITLNADGLFTFPSLPSGAAYAVTVQTPPNPAKVCSVARGVGTVGGANVTNVAIVCSTTTFTVGGTISGLPTGTSAVLQNNGTNNLTVPANGSFTFGTPIASGSDYLVSVLTNPTGPARTCVVTSGSGTATANVSSVVVTCTSKRIFISNSLGDDGVGVFSINATTGAATEDAHYTSAPDDAMGVAVTPSGGHVFATLRLSGLAGLRLRTYLNDSATGQLQWTGTDTVVSGGALPEVSIGQRKILVAPSGTNLYVLDFPNGAIVHFQFNPGLSSLTDLGPYTVQGLVDFVMTPDGQYMYGTSFDFNNVAGYRIQGNGSLSPLNPAVVATVTPVAPVTNSEMYLAADAQSRFLFVSQQRNSFINAYSINATTGALTFVNQVSTAGPGPTTLEVHAVATEPTGRFLYAANSDGNIWGYSINQTTGALTELAGSPFAGSGSTANAVKLTVDAAGRYLYKVSEASGNVTIYAINGTTGAITAAGSITPANGGLTDIALE